MSTHLGKLIATQTERMVSLIQDKTSWWLDITLGGDPSANLTHYSNPSIIVPEYWEQLVRNDRLIERCDRLCSTLSFTPLSRRL